MDNVIARRKAQKPSKIKKIFSFLFFLFLVLLLIVTITFSIPTLISYVIEKGYVSPITSGFSTALSSNAEWNEQMLSKELEKKGFEKKTVEVFDNGYIVTLDKGEKIIFSSKKSLDSQLASLQLISSRLTIEGKRFTSLDLRFDKPFIVIK